MAYKRKCFVGSPFNTLYELLEWIDAGFWVFIKHKAYHPLFIHNRLLGMVRGELREGLICACLDSNEEAYHTNPIKDNILGQ